MGSITPVVSSVSVDIGSRACLDDIVVRTTVKGIFADREQLRVNLNVRGQSVSVAARRISEGENPRNLSFITRLFWKQVTLQYKTAEGEIASERILLRRSSLNKRMPTAAVESKIDAACTAFPTVPRNQVSQLLKKLYSQEISFRLTDKSLRLDGNPIEVFSSHGTIYLKTREKLFNLDADEALQITPAEMSRVGPLEIPRTMNAFVIFNELFKKKNESPGRDFEVTCQGVKIYSKSGALFARYNDVVVNLSGRSPVFLSDHTKLPRGVRSYMETNNARLYQQYIEGECKPFIIHKIDSGLARSILYISPSQIYYLNNSHRIDMDPVLGTGAYKKVIGAWDMLTGKSMAVSIMALADRYYLSSPSELTHIRASQEADIRAEIDIRRPFKGEIGIVQTEAVHRYYSDRRRCEKVMIIEERYDSDLVDFLNSYEISLEDKKDIAKQLLRALEKLHQKGYIHRDIKPDNILIKKVGEKYEVCIADLGLSVASNDTKGKSKPCGTRGYLAPEYIAAANNAPDETRGNAVAAATTPACDIYAMGLVFMCLFGKEDTHGDLEIEDPQMLNIVQRMTNETPGERVTLDALQETFPFRG